MPNHAPAPTSLARAVRASLPGAASSTGFTLLETLLVVGGVALLSAGGFVIYQGAALNADVKTEQSNIQSIAQQSDRVYGSLGSYENLTTETAITAKVPPQSMVAGGTGLMSRWQKPVLLEPTNVGARSNAGLQITYQDVPAKACARLAQAASGGMFDVKVDGTSVFSGGKLDTPAAVSRCAANDTAPMVFTYYGGTSGLAGQVLAPVEIPAAPPTSAPVVVTVPPTAPPVAPPTAPPAPGCGPVPAAPASGLTPAGQTCSFFWQAVAAPSCWTSMPLCAPTVAPPPVVTPPSVPPPSIPPSTPPPGFCAVPPTSSRACATPNCSDGTPSVDTGTESQTFSCPVGRVISTPGAYLYASSAPQTRTRTRTANESASCPDPFDAPRWTNNGTFGAWTPTGAWGPTFACAPSCVAPATTNTPESQSAACNAGRVTPAGASTFTQGRTRTNTYSCSSPIATYTSNPATYSAWTPTEATACAPSCVAPAPLANTRAGAPQVAAGTPQVAAGTPESQVLPCGAGYTGSITQQRTTSISRTTSVSRTTTETSTTTYSCPAPTGAYTTTPGAWSAPGAPYGAFSAPGAPYGAYSAPGAPYGVWTTTANTCVLAPPSCVSAPGVPPMNSPGGPELVWLIACTANWGQFSTNMPDWNAIKAVTPVGGTRTGSYEPTGFTGGWQCVSTQQWVSPTTSGSKNDWTTPTISHVYAQVRWNGDLYTAASTEQTLNFDECDLVGSPVSPVHSGSCANWYGTLPPGLALVNAVNTPSTVHGAFYNTTCP